MTEVLSANYSGAFMTIKSALPLMQRGASIVVNGSIAELVGAPGGAGHYAASKAGLHATVRAMATELSPLGIRINVVAPGPIKTAISQRASHPPEQVAALVKKLKMTTSPFFGTCCSMRQRKSRRLFRTLS